MGKQTMSLVLLALAGMAVYFIVKQKPPPAGDTTDRAPTGQESFVSVSDEGALSGTYYF